MEQQNVGSKRSASAAGGKIAAKSHEAAEQLKDSMAEGADRVREKARSAKEQTSERIRDVAKQLESMSNSLRETDPLTAGLAESAGRGIESVARYVGSSDPRTLLRDTERLARRQPAIFFGSAFLLGLAAGRFLKSSAPAGYEPSDESDGGPLARTRDRDSGFFPPPDRSTRSNVRYQENYDATFGRDLGERETFERNGTPRTMSGIGEAERSTSERPATWGNDADRSGDESPEKVAGRGNRP